ncbi:MAG: N-acetylglucosamine-6-phosphate deacetylase [Erysipelotrichaceae bacterium]|nr:N-acetylglucosamine-6-phosphate deacetylase [Erysipelotrichaceae bacterium]
MILQSKRVWVLNTWIQAQIEMNDGKIVDILPYGEKPVDVDAGNRRIVPGFIDCHTHGANGFDTNDADEKGLREWIKEVVKEGVTGILPTTITQSEQILTNALKNVARVVKSGYEGAEILGVHFEGPYLDKEYKGAQPEQYCVPADLEQMKRYVQASEGLIKIITMACEHDADYQVTHYCSQQGIVVSQGHSSATYQQAAMAIAHGAKSMTHVYNGMTKFHHRDPGLVGAAFRFRDVYGEIICDGHHSSPEALNTFFKAKGDHYAVMITDSSLLKGMKPGTQTLFGGNPVELYEDGTAHLVHGGNLASSTLKVNQGLKILVEDALVSWQAAINSCTINPARMLGVDDRKGSIQVGKDADLVILEDNYDVFQTYVKGKEGF